MSDLNTSNQEQVVATETEAQVRKTYVEWHDAFPLAVPTVKVTFHGLFCFFFDGKDDCFVGTHNTTRQPGHQHNTHPHDYKIVIRRKEGGSTVEETPYGNGDPQSYPRLNFRVTGSSFPGGVAPGVYAYTGPNHDQFDRSPGNDRRDWRWIIDLEDRVYPSGVRGKNSAAFRPGIKLDNGLFYTERKTDSKFDLIAEGGGAVIPLNNVAEVMAANIYLAEGGSVRLTGGPVGERTLNHAPNRTFEIVINNLCDGTAHAICRYDPLDLDKKRRNDFFLYYDIFDPSLNRPEFLLIKRGLEPPARDDAPCGAIGFGQTPVP